MPIALFSIASSLHRGLSKPQDKDFIKEIEQALGEKFDFREDFADYNATGEKIIYVRTGCPGFQCNLSRISGDELLFAHCTVPLSMARSFTYDTHFESGIGTAIKAELPIEEITIAKLSPDIENIAVIPGRILGNQSEANLCRTQIVVEAVGAKDYFLKHSFANHHVIVPGHLY